MKLIPFNEIVASLRSIDSITLIVINLILIGLLLFQARANKKPMKWDTRKLVYGALCISLSFVLSYVKFFSLPQGGSVTAASLLPLMVYGYLFGPKYGLVAGIVYGFLQFIQEPYVTHIFQVALDYPIAFAAAGFFPGLLRTKSRIFNLQGGIVLAAIVRFVCHLLSGVIFFASYAGEQNVWAYSAGYNSFVFVDIAICMLVAVVLQAAGVLNSVKQSREA